jgi:hypothetical protein
MHEGKIVFSQLMDHLPQHSFRRYVERYGGERSVKRFSCQDQFRCMAFAQLTYRDSLRDTVTCLNAQHAKLYHMGIRGPVRRSTLADANERRDWRLYAAFASALIAIARRLYAQDKFGADLDSAAYALDTTTIDLCLSLFPWASFRRRKGALKLHTLLDLRGNIPCFIRVTPGKMHDVNALDHLPIQPGAFYIMDRGYLNFTRLHRFEHAKACFVIRAKVKLDFAVRVSRPVDKPAGLRCDQTIALRGIRSAVNYPDRLRRIRYTDPDTGRRLVLLTNCFTLDPITITQLYKARWRVELFFKWIKQNLRIKAFFGTSPNAVKTQLWIAVCVYVLLAILAKEQGVTPSPSEILRVLGVMLFEKTPIKQALMHPHPEVYGGEARNQLLLFNF